MATDAAHWTIDVAQKKLTADMNDLVEAMKRTIVHSDTLMEGRHFLNCTLFQR